MGKMKEKLLNEYSEGYDKGYASGYYDAIAEQSWDCGDCGNRYDSSVQFCPNKHLDEAIVRLKKAGVGYE